MADYGVGASDGEHLPIPGLAGKTLIPDAEITRLSLGQAQDAESPPPPPPPPNVKCPGIVAVDITSEFSKAVESECASLTALDASTDAFQPCLPESWSKMASFRSLTRSPLSRFVLPSCASSSCYSSRHRLATRRWTAVASSQATTSKSFTTFQSCFSQRKSSASSISCSATR